MTKEEVLHRRLDRAAERERLVRKNYMAACRKLIAYQIENFRIENNLVYQSDLHIDHDPISFALIVDCFRQKIKDYLHQDKLPVSISEFSSIGKMFMKYHQSTAKLNAVPAKENLEKASGQTRNKNYGMTVEQLEMAKDWLNARFDKMFGLPPEIPKRIIKPENRGRALQEYSTAVKSK